MSRCVELLCTKNILLWRHNERDVVLNHQPHDYRCRSEGLLYLSSIKQAIATDGGGDSEYVYPLINRPAAAWTSKYTHYTERNTLS